MSEDRSVQPIALMMILGSRRQGRMPAAPRARLAECVDDRRSGVPAGSHLIEHMAEVVEPGADDAVHRSGMRR